MLYVFVLSSQLDWKQLIHRVEILWLIWYYLTNLALKAIHTGYFCQLHGNARMSFDLKFYLRIECLPRQCSTGNIGKVSMKKWQTQSRRPEFKSESLLWF